MNRREAIAAGAAATVLLRAPGVTAQESEAPKVEDLALGAADAPVTMIEYASFTCPHCARFHNEVYPQLKADYIDPGKLRFVMREVYFDRPGLWASMLARCGGEKRYYPLVGMLFEKQTEWVGDGQPQTIAANLRRIGKVAGLSDAQIDACFRDAAKAEALVANYEANMAEYDISGTPAFVIDGTLHSNMGYQRMSSLIDEALSTS